MASTLRLVVISLVRALFEGEVKSVYLYGDEGEYEILPFHFPLLGALPEGEFKITTATNEIVYIGLRAGVVLMNENSCVIIIEELDIEQAIKYGQTLKGVELKGPAAPAKPKAG